MNVSKKDSGFRTIGFAVAVVFMLALSAGYVHSQVAHPGKEGAAIGIVNGTRVNIRQGPGTGHGIVGQVVQKGTVAIVEGKQGDWLKVYVNGINGWIYSKLIDVKDSEVEPKIEKEKEKTADLKKGMAPAPQPAPAIPPKEEPEPAAEVPVKASAANAAPQIPKEMPPPEVPGAEGAIEQEVPATRAAGYEQTLHKAVDLVFIFLNSMEQRQDIGIEEKQRMAVEFIRNIRWGPANRNYFWINDTQGNMILEPFFPSTEGKNLLSVRDKNDKEIIREFINTGLEFGEGFVDHRGLGYDDNKSKPTISIVRLFKKWGWIVGTGIELDLVETYEEPEGLNFNIPLPGINDEEPASSI